MFSTWVEKHNGLLEVLFTLKSDQSWEWVTFQVGGLRNNNNSAVTKAFHTLMIKRNRLVRYEMLIAKLSRGSSWSPAPVVLLEGPRLVMESTSPKRASVSLCFLLYSRWPRNRKQRYWVSALSPSSCTLTQNFKKVKFSLNTECRRIPPPSVPFGI